MGVISRKVLPICGSLCFFCPSMRARSRQPVKRYKKLLRDIFPKSQTHNNEHNDEGSLPTLRRRENSLKHVTTTTSPKRSQLASSGSNPRAHSSSSGAPINELSIASPPTSVGMPSLVVRTEWWQ
ncbi:hypothetical protein ACLOJK_015103 [Asimina triloba]